MSHVAGASGVDFRWRPFNVRHVMTGQKNIPFKDKPVKAAFMWRDIERRARKYGRFEPIAPGNQNDQASAKAINVGYEAKRKGVEGLSSSQALAKTTICHRKASRDGNIFPVIVAV